MNVRNVNCSSFCFGSWCPCSSCWGTIALYQSQQAGSGLSASPSSWSLPKGSTLPQSVPGDPRATVLTVYCQTLGLSISQDSATLSSPSPCMLMLVCINIKFAIPMFELCGLDGADLPGQGHTHRYILSDPAKPASHLPPPAFLFHPSTPCRHAPLK